MSEKLPKDQYISLLPLYLHLDPSPIPDLEALESFMVTATRPACIDSAAMSLNALAGLVVMCLIPTDAYPEIWSRVSAWMLFLHTYWDYLPGYCAFDEIQACANHTRIISIFVEHCETAAILFATRGVRRIIARALLVLLPDATPAARVLCPVLWNLLANGVGEMTNFEEIIDAVGGTLANLPSMLVKEIAQTVAASRSEMTVASIGAVMA
ncbi:hypothetical protein B0H13DRAFT_2310575 [Mycena leptocephala]|nr:hypothetical protein B0H13DRAFT_2310575 [Mycena leptocephala]